MKDIFNQKNRYEVAKRGYSAWLEQPLYQKKSKLVTMLKHIFSYSVCFLIIAACNTNALPTQPVVQEPINPTIIKVCPAQPVVSLAELGLSLDDRIIAVSYDDPLYYSTGGLFTIKTDDSTIQPINNTIPTEGELNIFSGKEVSPDGKWIIYQRGHQQDNQLTLWISSIDGQQQWELATIPRRNLTNWISDQEIIVADYENLEPVIRIYPFSHTLENLPPMPPDTESLGYFIRDTDLYNVYFGGDFDNSAEKFVPKFVLYNYATQSEQEIFHWMATEELTGGIPGANIMDSLWNFWNTGNGFTIVAIKPYGFDLGSDLDFAAAVQSKSYDNIMKPIMLPEGDPNLDIIWSFKLTNSFAFERYDREKSEPNLQKFYIFDYQHMILKDYCLDRGHTLVWGSYSSPDERFLGWTVYELDGGYIKGKEIVVLNLETGKVARIPHAKLIGWGTVAQ